MKVRKIVLIICVTLLVALSFVSCRKKPEATVYYRSTSARGAITSATQISLGGYSFDSFLNRGRIKVSEQRGDSVYYGVLSDRGETLIPVQYVSLEDAGDFYVAEGGVSELRHYVFSQNGTELCSFDEAITVADVGGGYFSVATDSASFLYNGEGRNVLPGNLLDASYEYSVCGNFAMARSAEKGGTFLFDLRTSDTLRSFFDTSERKYAVAYAGGNDFIVVATDRLDSADGCDIEINRDGSTLYYKQTVRRYTIGITEPSILLPGQFIVKIQNRYSIGYTEEDRENFGLLDGYSAVSYYVTDGKKATGALNSYITDASMKELKSLPDGVSALFAPVDGIAAAVSSSGAILFLDESAEVVGKIDDAIYQNVFFSGEIVTAAKITETGVRLGGFDREGKLVIPFEYSYISVFAGGKAVATREGKAYLMTASGERTYIGDYTMPHYFDGFYQTVSGELVGATSFEGVELISPSYTSFTAVRRYQNTVFVALNIGSVVDVYRLY